MSEKLETVAWAATSEENVVEALSFNSSRSRFTTALVFRSQAESLLSERDATIAEQASALELAHTSMVAAKNVVGWDEVPYKLHVALDALFDTLDVLPSSQPDPRDAALELCRVALRNAQASHPCPLYEEAVTTIEELKAKVGVSRTANAKSNGGL